MWETTARPLPNYRPHCETQYCSHNYWHIFKIFLKYSFYQGSECKDHHDPANRIFKQNYIPFHTWWGGVDDTYTSFMMGTRERPLPYILRDFIKFIQNSNRINGLLNTISAIYNTKINEVIEKKCMNGARLNS